MKTCYFTLRKKHKQSLEASEQENPRSRPRLQQKRKHPNGEPEKELARPMKVVSAHWPPHGSRNTSAQQVGNCTTAVGNVQQPDLSSSSHTKTNSYEGAICPGGTKSVEVDRAKQCTLRR